MNRSAILARTPHFLSYVVFFALLAILVVFNVNDITNKPYDWGLATRAALIAGGAAALAFVLLPSRARVLLQIIPLAAFFLGLVSLELREMSAHDVGFRPFVWMRVGLIGVLALFAIVHSK